MKKSMIALIVAAVATFAAMESVRADDSDSDDAKLAQAKKVIHSDMQVISGFKFTQTSALHKKIFGGADGTSVAKFFNSRVHEFNWQEAAVGIMASVDPGTGVMNVGSQVFQADMPQMARMSIFIHEARHTESENGNWGHVGCADNMVVYGKNYYNPWVGSLPGAACDDSEMGAYGVQYVFSRSVANSCSNCTDKMKMDAAIYSDDEMLNRMTNAEAAERLIVGANISGAKAYKEFDTVYDNALKNSGGAIHLWNEACEKANSCFKAQ